MRAGPLSNPRVIALLNGHFVCVYTSNDAIPGDEATVAREKAERQRLRGEFFKAKLGFGDVNPVLVTWDAKPLGRLSIGPACEKDNLLHLLEKTVTDLKLANGEPVVKPSPQAAAPPVPAGSLLLNLTARKLTPRYSWNEFPSENWIVLTAEQCRKLMPAGGVSAGKSWDIDRATAALILTHFYPQTEVCTANESSLLSETGPYRHRIEELALKGTVIAVEKGMARIRLDGSLKLRHGFYPGREDKNHVEARLVGYLDYDVSKRTIRSLKLITDQAKYANIPIGVAVRSIP